MSNRKNRTARHDGRIVPPPPDPRKPKMRFSAIERPTLFEIWLKVRGVSLHTMAEWAHVVPNTLYNLLEDPGRARDSTLNAIALAIREAGGALTGTQVLALASRRVRNPDRVSEEMGEILARAAAAEAS